MEVERIEKEDFLYRRVAANQLNPDGTVSSAAFKLHGKADPSLSVDLARLTTPRESLDRARNPTSRLGQLNAEVPIGLGLTVRHAPIEGNVSHSLVEGATIKAQYRMMAQATILFDLSSPQLARS